MFANGDLVVRFKSLFGSVDRTVESVYLSRAEVERGFAWTRCRISPLLRIYFMGMDARAECITVPQCDVSDDVRLIADHINDSKAKSLTSSAF